MNISLENYLSFAKISIGELLGSLPMGIILFDSELNIIFRNDNISHFGIDGLDDLTVETSLSFIKFLGDADFENIKSGSFIEKEISSQKTMDGGKLSIILKIIPFMVEDTLNGGILLLEDMKLPAAAANSKSDNISDNFDNILNSIYGLFQVVTPEGKILFAGGNKYNDFILPSNKNSETIYDVFQKNISDKIIPSFKASVTKRKSEEIIIDIVRGADAESVEYYECQIFPVINKNERVNLIFIALREITVFLKMIEKYKQENNELINYQRFTEDITTSVFVINISGKIVFWNKASEGLFKLRRSEVFGKNISKILPYFEGTKLKDILSKLQESPMLEMEQMFFVLNSGQTNLNIKIKKIYVNSEDFLIYEVFNLSDKANVIDSLNNELRFFSDICGKSKNPIIGLNSEGLILYKNKEFLNTFNFPKHDSETYFIDLLPQSYIIEHDLTFKMLIGNNESINSIVLNCAYGEPKRFNIVFFYSEKFSENTMVGCVFENIDEGFRIQEDLKKFKTIFSYSSDGLALINENRISSVNKSFMGLLGYTTEQQLINKEFIDLVSDADKNMVISNLSKITTANESGIHFDFLALTKHESNLYMSATITPLVFEEKINLLLAVRDITELKRVQVAIKESEERYRSITDNIDDFFWSSEKISNALLPTFCSTSVFRMTGYTQIEFMSDSKMFFKIIYPDDFKIVKERLQKLYKNVYKRGDEVEFRIIHKNGNVVWVRNKISIVRDKKGNPQKIFGIVSDITLQKNAEQELKLSTDNLKKLNDTKDKFISIISHDLRTPFSSVLGFTDILLNEDDITPEESRQYIQYIQESSKNMLSLVNSLLDWTRIQTGRIDFEPVTTQFNVLVQQVLSGMTGFALQKRIELINEVPEDVSLMVDKSLATQALNNLISNALKFTNENGRITVKVQESDQPRFVEISVIDTGIGIKQSDIDKIFTIESKYTTEGTYGEKGTGLGLTLVKEIIEKHNGKIWVVSEFGKGAEFHFTLPRASAQILLIDDSSTDRILYSKIVKNIVGDFEVITANNGKEGLHQIQNKLPALIICDHSMPVMNGFEFMNAYNSLNIKGKPPIMILSSDIGKNEHAIYSDLGVEYIFTKPVSLTSFKAAIEKTLKKIPK